VQISTAIRLFPLVKALYERLVGAGKAKMAVGACRLRLPGPRPDTYESGGTMSRGGSAAADDSASWPLER
jgi:hypothetical protein